MSKKRKTEESSIYSVRLPISLNKILETISNEYLISRSLLIKLALYEYVPKFEECLKSNGVDLEKHCEIQKNRLFRSMIGVERNELLSGVFFISRVRYDLYKMVKSKATPKNILEYIETRKREIKLYPKELNIVQEFNDYINSDAVNYKKLLEMVNGKMIEVEQHNVKSSNT